MPLPCVNLCSKQHSLTPSSPSITGSQKCDAPWRDMRRDEQFQQRAKSRPRCPAMGVALGRIEPGNQE
jgi:hypothetical protein